MLEYVDSPMVLFISDEMRKFSKSCADWYWNRTRGVVDEATMLK